jgi:tRNA G18 (ribose-2'-O)-methylase SpoU
MDDTRNVVDKYKGWHADLIKKDLNAHTFPYAAMMQSWGDFNMGTMIRNANAFAAKEVFYCGKRKWDRRGAQGTYNYTSVSFLEDLDSVKALTEKYHLIAIDNVPGATPLNLFDWPHNSLMIFGSEGEGISKDILNLCERIVEIPMYGSVRSLNCGTSSGIVMADYVRKYQENCTHFQYKHWDNECPTCRLTLKY